VENDGASVHGPRPSESEMRRGLGKASNDNYRLRLIVLCGFCYMYRLIYRKQNVTGRMVKMMFLLCRIFVCQIHVHGFGRLSDQWISVRAFVRGCVRYCVTVCARIASKSVQSIMSSALNF